MGTRVLAGDACRAPCRADESRRMGGILFARVCLYLLLSFIPCWWVVNFCTLRTSTYPACLFCKHSTCSLSTTIVFVWLGRRATTTLLFVLLLPHEDGTLRGVSVYLCRALPYAYAFCASLLCLRRTPVRVKRCCAFAVGHSIATAPSHRTCLLPVLLPRGWFADAGRYHATAGTACSSLLFF